MNQNRNNIDKLVKNNQNNEMRKPTDIDKIIAKNLRTIRKQHKINLQNVASNISVSYQQLRKYETAENRISAGKLWDLSLIYNRPIQDFFKDTN